MTEMGYVALPGKNKRYFVDRNAPIVRTVSSYATLAESQCWMEAPKDREFAGKLLQKLWNNTERAQLRACCVASMIALAEGKIDGYFFPTPQPFDIAAAALIVEKAGGKVTEWDGSPWNAFSKSIVASNGVIHDELLKLINS